MEYAFFIVYIILYMILLFTLLFSDICFVKYIHVIIYFLLFFVLVFLAGTNTTGTDFDSYNQYFNRIEAVKFPYFIEIGFQVIVIIFKRLGLSFYQFWFFLEFLSLVLLFSIVHKLYKNYYYALLFILLYIPKYYFVGNNNQIRSVFVYAIALLGVLYIYKKKYILYSLSVSIVGLMHTSAYTLLSLVFIKKYTRMIGIIIVGMGFLGSFFPFNRFTFHRYFISAETVSFFSIQIIRRIFLFLFFLTIYKKTLKKDILFPIKFVIYSISLSIYLFFLRAPIIAERLSAVFGVIEIPILMTVFVKIIKPYVLSVFILLLYAITDFFLRGYLLYIPYY